MYKILLSALQDSIFTIVKKLFVSLDLTTFLKYHAIISSSANFIEHSSYDFAYF